MFTSENKSKRRLKSRSYDRRNTSNVKCYHFRKESHIKRFCYKR